MQDHPPVASYRHSLIFLGIVVAVTLAGFSAQNRPGTGGGLVESHAHVIPVYLSVTVMNWLLVLFVWKGVRKRGGSFSSLIGGRWGSAWDVLRDLGIAAIFWAILLATAWGLHRALGEPSPTPAALVRRVQDVVVRAADGRLRDDATLLAVRMDAPGGEPPAG